MVFSVCPSVRLSHIFHYVPINRSSWNCQELLPMTKVKPWQKVQVRRQWSRSQKSRPNLTVRDCNSSFNSRMMMKWYIKLDVAWKRCPIVFQGHPANRPSILTQIGRFRTVIPVWIHQWLRNDIQSLKWHKRGALLFFKVISQISRSHG